MRARVRRAVATVLDRTLLALAMMLVLVLLALGALTTGAAHSMELVPQAVIGGPMGGHSTETTFGLALRQPMGPALESEIAAGLRFGDLANDGVRALQSPLTASLWVTPAKLIYAGGGVGWYPRDLWSATTESLEDRSTFGWHAGGGVRLPVLPPVLGLDLGARWIYRGDGAASRLFGLSRADAFATTAGVTLNF